MLYVLKALLTLLLVVNFSGSVVCVSMYTLLHKYVSIALLVWLLTLIVVDASNHSCPAWFYFNNTTNHCNCGPYENGLRCNQEELKIEVADGYCVSHIKQKYYSGNCLYAHPGNYTNGVFSEAPRSPDILNEYLCGSYNRKGFFCGSCIDGYGPAVYSLEMKCVDCSKFSPGVAIILYLLLESIPTTIFFLFVMVTRLNITAGPLLGYVIFCQSYVFGIETKPYMLSHVLNHSSQPFKYFVYSSLALSNVWLLNIAWIFTPPFCISAKFTNIDIIQLRCVRPVIPSVLFVSIFMVVKLRDRNFWPIKCLWKHLRATFKWMFIVRPVDGSSVIHTFASFLFLSSYVSNFTIIAAGIRDEVLVAEPHYVYMYATGVSDQVQVTYPRFVYDVVYFDPNIPAYGARHFRNLATPVVCYILFVVIPCLLLVIYPTRLYRSLTRFISQRKQLAITAFAEALHSCFKNGLGGTRDFRALAGLSMTIDLVYPNIAYGCYVALCKLMKPGYTLPVLSGLILILLSLLLSYLRPCKSLLANISLSYHIMALGILNVSITIWTSDSSTSTATLETLIFGLPMLSHMVVLGWVGHLLVKKILAHVMNIRLLPSWMC